MLIISISAFAVSEAMNHAYEGTLIFRADITSFSKSKTGESVAPLKGFYVLQIFFKIRNWLPQTSSKTMPLFKFFMID